MEKLFIIDASGYLYRAYHAIRNMTNKEGKSTNALFGFIRSVLKLIEDFKPTHIVAVFDGPNNTAARKALYPEYKAHREKMPEDLYPQIGDAKQFCKLFGIPYLDLPEVEADDVMGSVASYFAKKNVHAYLCSSDKDLAQLVSSHIYILNTHKDNLILDAEGVKASFGVAPQQICDYLAIIGDASDNVPGIPGLGPKTAAALLEKAGSLENLLQNPALAGGKKEQQIKESKEKARLGYKLVCLDTSIAVPHDTDFYLIKPHLNNELKSFYEEKGFLSLLKNLSSNQPQQIEKRNYHLVNDEESLKCLIDLLNENKEIAFDTETVGLHPLEARIVGIGFCIEAKTAYYVPFNGKLGKERVLLALKTIFSNPELRFFGHNVKFDCHVLANASIDIPKISFDTLLASYLLNAHQRQHNLDALTLEYFGKVKIDIGSLLGKGKQTRTMEEVPLDEISEYCCEDADYTFRLKEVLEKELEKRNLAALLYDLELPLLAVLFKMERRGIFIDKEALKIFGKEISEKIKSLESSIFEYSKLPFNLNSPKQLSEVLLNLGIPLKKGKTGYSTNASELEKFQNKHPIIPLVMKYRMYEKLRSTYVDALSEEICPKTGRVHCTFSQSTTATGRLSSLNPNLQNIPVRSEEGKRIREAFRPEKEGWAYVALDYSQIELRLVAHFSEDPTLIRAFHENRDIHTHTASEVFQIPESEITSQMRYQAKGVNFGIIYGQQSFGLSQQLGISEKEAKAFIAKYFERYPSIRHFLDRMKKTAAETLKAVTLLGRERLIPELSSTNFMIRSTGERLAINTPLQGTAADLIKLAMLKIDAALQKEHVKGYLILQIHDELIFEVPEEEIPIITRIAKKEMEEVFPLKVPLVVDVAVGRNWKEC